MADVGFLTIPELGRLLRLRRLSAVELAAELLGRLERLGPTYHAVVRVLRDSALADARERDAELARGKDRGPLHGIPFGVKDLVSVEGAPPDWAAPGYRTPLPHGDATVVRRLRRAGAVLCAKLAMAEFAGGVGARSSAEGCGGPGRTPWDGSRWSGGSSSGPGAAVAAGLVPFAIGSETWGSIQYPAAFCGITGPPPQLRPGEPPRRGRAEQHDGQARTDGADGGGLRSRARRRRRGPIQRTRRPWPGGSRHLRPPIPAGTASACCAGRSTGRSRRCSRNFLASLEVLGGVADVVDELDLPDYPYDALAGLVLDAEAASAFEPLLGGDGSPHWPRPRTESAATRAR